MKRTRKQIGSLLLSVFMVFTMLPTAAFAEEGVQDSGTSPGTSEITAFADLAEDVALQEVETGTTVEELNLPSTLTVTVTTGSAITATVSGDDVATDSEAQETETQEETTIEVSNWVADPDYDGDTAGDYTFTPTLDISEDISVAAGVTPPQITVTVEETAAPMLLGAEMQLLGTGTGTDITDDFTDANFLAAVYAAIGKTAPEAVYDTDVAGFGYLTVSGKSISSLAGIEHFTALTFLGCDNNQLTALDVSNNTRLTHLSCSNNQLTALDVNNNTRLTHLYCFNDQLTALDVSSNTALTELYCSDNQLTTLDVSNNTLLTTLDCNDNQLTTLDVSKNTALTMLDCSNNYMTDQSAVTGLDESRTTTFTFNPQKTTYAITVNSGTAKPSIAAENATVTITANTPDSDKQFKEWTVVSGGVTLTSTTLATTTFTMPANAVVVTATYEDISAGATDITNKFKDSNFLAAVYAAIGKTAPEAIYDTDVSGITTLNVSGKSISSLAGIEHFTALSTLVCNVNQLTALDVSINTALTELYCSDNQLTALDVSSNTALSWLDCSNNYMTDQSAVTGLDESRTTTFTFNPQKITYAITVNSGTANPSIAAENATVTITANTPDSDKQFKEWTVVSGGVTLTSTTLATTTFTMPANAVVVTATYEDISAGATDITNKFKDSNFLAAVYAAIGKTAPEAIYDTDVSGITSLDVSGKSISSLAGIEYFTALTTLNCSTNQLTALDVSKNTKLTALRCYDNKLSTLDVSNNIKLTKLWCHGNQLTSLDVSKNTELVFLNCSGNYMPDQSAVTGLDESRTTTFIFNPQKTTYAITVNSGTANPSIAASGATVTITANTPDNGKRFKAWSVVSGGVVLDSTTSASTTFTMPANAVEITATYENILAGVSVSTAAELKTALEATTSYTISVTADITFTEQITQGADHTLAISNDKTVTASGSLGFIDIGSHTLTINGGGTFVCNRNGNALYSNNGILNLENITVNVTGGTGGILVKTINLDNSATVNLNSTSGNQLIRLIDGYTLNINMGGTIEITNFNKSGIANQGGTLNINGGSLTVGKGQSDNQTGIEMSGGLLKYSSGTLNATNDAVIAFTQSASAEGVSGRFIDGGYTLAASGKINIGAADATPSADGLTAGYYHWNSSKNAFEKQMITIEKQPQDVTVTEGIITGSLSVTASASNAGTISYQWRAAGNTISGAVDATYMLPTDLTAGTHKYQCLITAPGCMYKLTRFVTVTVNPAGGASTYAVTINNGTASLSTAASGATVTITANTPDNGKQFKAWSVVSGGVTLASTTSATTTFTMPAKAVEVTATYEDISAGVTPVTGVTLNKNSLSLYSNTSPNKATLIATVAPASATDKSVTWQSSNTTVATVDASGNLRALRKGTATIIVSTTDGGHTASCTVTVLTYKSGGGSSSSGSSSTTTTTTTEKKPNQPVTAAAPITATAGTNGAASASIPDKAISDAITKAQADAKAQGKTTNGVSVALNVTMPKEATALTATLSRNALNSLVSAGVTSLKIKGSPVMVAFDQKALTEIQKKSSGNINITIAPKTNLSEIAKKMIGTRPVYNITVNYDNSSTVSSFGGGAATVGIPYAPANGEAIGGVYALYVDEKGNATRIAGSAYDANSGCVIFTTPHFSMYGVGYTAPSAKFTDINSHWAKESIDYVVGRGLLSGTTETTFAPDTAMTRGMLVEALGRLAGVDTKAYTTSSFTDVNGDSTYRPYIVWAYSKGIIQGIGSNQFAPDRAITREEIAVIIANFAKATGYTLPVTREATTYADASSIASTYKTAVTAMQQAGIMMGGTSNKFNPKSNATRAEVSSMLGHYIKLTIDPDTAQGWTLNDAGQYLYYKDGKALTGIQTIDGVKYVFNSNGVLQTGWVKDGDNWRYYSGNNALVGWHDIGANGNNKTYYFNKDGIMTSRKWLEIDGKWYYFYMDGSLVKSTKIDGYEVDENGVRKTK